MKTSVYQWGRLLLWSAADEKQAEERWPSGDGPFRPLKRPSVFFKSMASDYLLVMDAEKSVSCGPAELRRLLSLARDTHAGMIYSDYVENINGKFTGRSLIDYQAGSCAMIFISVPFSFYRKAPHPPRLSDTEHSRPIRTSPSTICA